ncbi:SMP-30/gluconolactonase/LRE family protein [Naasia sp. SYSU D00948]|uniref:SMP-30/gluconolactonase/LRE family protein n=1 Tax=Naasia sp. SYSU D00948 TaxID=2817379 RepID=UPI001B3147C1|nr:SMP-30/gluconolactonase/LRE family protein [Naasia sp. SYSU D00948]
MGQAEQVTESCTYHGEGAFWDELRQRVRFVDMLAGDVVTLLPTGTVTRRHLGDVAAVVRARAGGGYVVAVEHGFLLLDEDWQPERSIRVLDDPQVRMNEGGCDPQGRFYCGTMAYDTSEGAGTLYRLEQDLSVATVLPAVTIPNGLVWSPDGATAYHSDTGPAVISAYRFDAAEGRLLDPQVLIRFDPDRGAPDGVAIDAEGGLWVALWGGGAVARYSPDGKLTERIELPVSNVTSCAFGGEDRRTLYITTSQQGVDLEREPAAGALFAAEVGVAGRPLDAFAG